MSRAPRLTYLAAAKNQPQEETQLMKLASATPATEAVVNHHLDAFYALDLQGVVVDYAPDAVMIVPNAVLRGVPEIQPFFQNLFAEFAKPGAKFDLREQVVEGDVAYIWWVAETADNTYELGTDTFFVREGKIAAQTFAFKATPRS
jgi:ketosteroid isomerase-like protein